MARNNKEIYTFVMVLVVLALLGVFGAWKFFTKYMSIPHSAKAIAVEIKNLGDEVKLLREEVSRLREVVEEK